MEQPVDCIDISQMNQPLFVAKSPRDAVEIQQKYGGIVLYDKCSNKMYVIPSVVKQVPLKISEDGDAR